MGVLRVVLNRHVNQREEECKGGGGTTWESEEKDLLRLQMQEAHLIGTLRCLHWHCGPSPPPACPRSESLQLPAALRLLQCQSHAGERRSDAQARDLGFLRNFGLWGEVIWASCGPWLQKDYGFSSLGLRFNNIYLHNIHLISFLVKNKFPISHHPYREWNSLIN